VSTPVKHHFVPQFLLRNFADAKEQLVVHRLAAQKPFVSTVKDVGHRNDGHTLYLSSGPDREMLEGAMNEIETETAGAANRLVEGEDLTDADAEVMSWFFALQWSRHRHLYNQISSQVDTTGLSPEEVATSLLRVTLFPLLMAWNLREDPSAHYKDQWNHVQTVTRSLQWRTVRFNDDVLVLGDNTVCMSGTRPGFTPDFGAAWARHGFGVALHAAARITVPLSPRVGLLLTADGKPERLSALAFNRTTIYNSREFVVHHPEWKPTNPNIGAAFNENLETQRILAPVFVQGRF
jgi:hypothetical protein